MMMMGDVESVEPTVTMGEYVLIHIHIHIDRSAYTTPTTMVIIISNDGDTIWAEMALPHPMSPEFCRRLG